MLRLSSIVAAALGAIVGSSAAFAQGLDPELVGTWRVVEIDGKPAEHGEMFKFADEQIEGKSACNYVRAKVKQAGGRARDRQAHDHRAELRKRQNGCRKTALGSRETLLERSWRHSRLQGN